MNNENKSITLHEMKWRRVLWNPFVYIAGVEALVLGVAAILLAGFLGSLGNTHFDGVLDTHTGAHVPLWVFLSEGIIDWLCLALVLLVLGRLISKTSFRTVDLLGTQALARWPTVFISLLLLPKAVLRFANDVVEQIQRGGKLEFNPSDAAIFFAVMAGLIVFICWMVALMYKSFSISCNVKGGKAIGTFIGGLIIAEIISKLCLAPLLGGATAHPPIRSLGAAANGPAVVLASVPWPLEGIFRPTVGLPALKGEGDLNRKVIRNGSERQNSLVSGQETGLGLGGALRLAGLGSLWDIYPILRGGGVLSRARLLGAVAAHPGNYHTSFLFDRLAQGRETPLAMEKRFVRLGG